MILLPLLPFLAQITVSPLATQVRGVAAMHAKADELRLGLAAGGKVIITHPCIFSIQNH